MSKKKRQKLTPWSLGSLPTTPVTVKNPDYETDAQLKARLRREEAEAKRNADPIYQAEQSLTKTMRELQKLSSIYWSRPVAELTGVFKDEGAKDLTFSVPALRSQYTNEEAGVAFDLWHEQTFKPAGYEFAESGAFRLIRFGLSQGALVGADMSNAAAWQTAFLHLRDNLKAFQPGDFDKEPQRVAGPAPKPTLADIERLNIEGDAEQARQARWIVNDLASSQFRPLVEEWLGSLKTAFALYPTDAQMQKVVAWFRRNNAYWGDRRNYDRVRKYMILVEREWPESALTRQEILELEIEQGNLNDYDTRRSLLARTRS